MLTVKQIMDKYGKPGDPALSTTLKFPYPMRLAWAPDTIVHTTSCHKLVAPQFTKVFEDILAHYGIDEIKRLGLDLFGGITNVRPMRGTEAKHAAALKAGNLELAYTYLSRHAWGIAIDLDPSRNGLKTKWLNAQFSKADYQFMVDTFYKHGFMSYGKDRNYDAMHFEINQ
jgi:hypothetical protein